MKALYRLKRFQRLIKPSPAEKAFIQLWHDMGFFWRLRYKYRREYRLSGYFLDFALVKQRIDIEIDGKFHKDVIGQWEHDRKRDYHLQQKGWAVLRFDAKEVFQDPDWVKYALRYYLVHGKKPRKQRSNHPRIMK